MEKSSTLNKPLRPFIETLHHKSIIYEYSKQHLCKNVTIYIISTMYKGELYFIVERIVTNRFTKKQKVQSIKCDSFQRALQELHKWK